MKILVVSLNGDSAGLVHHFVREKHDVSLYLKTPSDTMKGVSRRVPTISAGLREGPELIVFDMVGMGKEADRLRDQGFNVVGGSAWADRLELDRAFGIHAMETFGLTVPKTYTFLSLKEAYDFAEDHNRLLVLKPHGNKNTAFTFVPKTQDELLALMRHLQKNLQLAGKVTLQEYVEGTEISTEVWYSKGNPVPYPESTIETKRLFSGDVGPMTGAETSMVFGYRKREPKLVQQSLKKMRALLERIQYTGPLDVNGIVRNGRYYALEFTPRLGYNAIYAMLRVFDGDFAQFLLALATGKDTELKLKDGYGFSMRVSIPPYPFKPEDRGMMKAIYTKTRGIPIEGVDDEPGVFMQDAYKDEEGWKTAGVDGCIAEVTGYGITPMDAEIQATELFRKLSLPFKQARLGDGARVANKRMGDLAVGGYEVPPFVEPKPIVVEVQAVAKSPVVEKEEKDDVEGKSVPVRSKPPLYADPQVKTN